MNTTTITLISQDSTYKELTIVAEKLRYCDAQIQKIRQTSSTENSLIINTLEDRKIEAWKTEKNEQWNEYQQALPDILDKLNNSFIIFQSSAYYQKHLYGEAEKIASSYNPRPGPIIAYVTLFAALAGLFGVFYSIVPKTDLRQKEIFLAQCYTMIAFGTITATIIPYFINLIGINALRNHFNTQPQNLNPELSELELLVTTEINSQA